MLLNERLYCSLYKDLNDPFKGMFWEVLGPARIPNESGQPIVIPIQKRESATIEKLFHDSDYKTRPIGGAI